MMIMLIALAVLGLMGTGAFLLMRSSSTTGSGSTQFTVTAEGLQIMNASGSVEPNGDLLISGVIENSGDKERVAWYVVVDVFDASGGVMSKLRLLNGKQLFTHADYDVLAKRGVNIQELKFKALQQQGVVIPAKGKVNFEVRYLQPPIGIASFNATVQPFDPVRLYKEIANDAR